MLKEVKGNLLDMFDEDKFTHIIHGCNCFNTLGEGTAAGIAKQIGERYPETKKADSLTSKGDYNKLGTYEAIPIKGKHKYVINAYTQYFPGKHFEYSALMSALSFCLMDEIFEDLEPDTKIGIPLIGCGIGGGDWNIVKQIIADYLGDYDVTIVHYDMEK